MSANSISRLVYQIRDSIDLELGEKYATLFADDIMTRPSEFFVGLLYYNNCSIDILHDLLKSDYKIINKQDHGLLSMGNGKFSFNPIGLKQDDLIPHKFTEYLLENTEGHQLRIGEIETQLERDNLNYKRWYVI